MRLVELDLGQGGVHPKFIPEVAFYKFVERRQIAQRREVRRHFKQVDLMRHGLASPSQVRPGQ